MGKTLFAAAAALAIVSGPALAKGQNDESTRASAAAKQKAERKICRTYPATESRMKSTRLCLTRAQWKKFEDVQ